MNIVTQGCNARYGKRDYEFRLKIHECTHRISINHPFIAGGMLSRLKMPPCLIDILLVYVFFFVICSGSI